MLFILFYHKEQVKSKKLVLNDSSSAVFSIENNNDDLSNGKYNLIFGSINLNR